jgi:hypothetical protein
MDHLPSHILREISSYLDILSKNKFHNLNNRLRNLRSEEFLLILERFRGTCNSDFLFDCIACADDVELFKFALEKNDTDQILLGYVLNKACLCGRLELVKYILPLTTRTYYSCLDSCVIGKNVEITKIMFERLRSECPPTSRFRKFIENAMSNNKMRSEACIQYLEEEKRKIWGD